MAHLKLEVTIRNLWNILTVFQRTACETVVTKGYIFQKI